VSDDARAAAADRIRRVARAMGDIHERLVFIGASVLPLLAEVDQRLAAPRTTKDVDAVAATTSYVARAKLEESLRARGFRHQPLGHAGRWLSPSGEIFDLSFAGDHLGGTGSSIDAIAIASANVLEGDPPIRHLSGAGFLIMKSAAFGDRGRSAPHESKDLADIAVLLAGRSTMTFEVESADAEIQRAVGGSAAQLLAVRELAPALRGHFSDRRPIPPDTPDELTVEAIGVLARLRAGR
jgi:hypothetical protein